MKQKPKFSCVVDTTYSLSLYLLYVSEEDIRRTAFFVGNTIPKTVSDKLPFVVRINTDPNRYACRKKILLRRRIEALVKWRFRIKTFMYAQDHLVYSPQIIGRSHYFLLEDAPNVYTNYKTLPFFISVYPKTLKERIKTYVFYGPIGIRRLGTNKQCVDRLVTSPTDLDSDLLKGKKYTLVDMRQLWEQSSKTKQEYILSLFGIGKTMLDIAKACHVIIFTQPLVEDCGLTEQEMMDIYKPYIEKYADEGVIIKPHPRDKFDYAKNFPQTAILDCMAPMQLLNAMGMDFKTAVTVCSSAVTAMSDDTRIIWMGAAVNKKILRFYGDLKNPRQTAAPALK